MNNRNLFLDVLMGHFLIEKGLKKTHKIKETDELVSESLKRNIIDIQTGVFLSTEVIDEFNGQKVSFDTDFSKQFRSLARHENFFDSDFSCTYHIRPSVDLSAETLMDMNDIEHYFNPYRNLFAEKTTLMFKFGRTRESWRNPLFYEAKAKCLFTNYSYFCRNILQKTLEFYMAIHAYPDSDLPSMWELMMRRVNARGVFSILYKHESRMNLPFEDFLSVPELVQKHFEKEGITEPTVDQLAIETYRAEFIRDLYLFAQNAMTLERLIICSTEERVDGSSIGISARSLTFEVGFEMEGLEMIGHIPEILGLVKKYLQYSMLQRGSTVGRVPLDNPELEEIGIAKVMMAFTDVIISTIFGKFDSSYFTDAKAETIHFGLFTVGKASQRPRSSSLNETSDCNKMSEFRFNTNMGTFEDVSARVIAFESLFAGVPSNVTKYSYLTKGFVDSSPTILKCRVDKRFMDFKPSVFLARLVAEMGITNDNEGTDV